MTLNWQYNSGRRWLTGAFILLLICAPWVAAETVITLGPYDSEESLAKVTTFLDASNIPFDSNQDAVTESLGFIVVTAQIPPAVARATIDALREQRVEDLLYIRSGVYINRLSAGVYSTEENAKKRTAKLSGHGFSVVERTRTLSSASITVSRADITPSFEEIFQAITGVQIPRDIVIQTIDTKKSIVLQTEPVGAIEPPVGSLKNEENEGTNATEETLEAVKKVIRIQPPEKESFPLIPFLLIATSVVIVFILGYYYLGRRSQQPARVQFKTAEPQQTLLYQEVISQAQRQLDSSVGAISAYANQLLAGQTPAVEEIPQYIATIRSGGIEVLDLISDIIDLSRIEIGQVEIERISFDPDSALQDLVKSLSLKAELKGISLHFEPDQSLPNLIASDPTKLEKILSILVSYSIENTESGRVLITATFLEQLNSLKITIKHTSENFSSLTISEMFEPIESTAGINTEQRLRFAVSKRLANLMGGDIQVVSQSDHDIEYVVTVQADEILKKQLMLPSGLSIDELVQSEEEARELADNAQLALVTAQTQVQQATRSQIEAESKLAMEVEAKTQAETRAKADAERIVEAESLAAKLTAEKQSSESDIEKWRSELSDASTRAESLSVELQTAIKAASNEVQERARLEIETTEKILQLTSEISTAKSHLQNEIGSRSESESSTNDTIAELQKALEQASISVKDETQAKEHSEQKARKEIEEISQQLTEAEATGKELTRQLQTHGENKNQVDELHSALSDAKARLQSEIDLHSNADVESESQIKTLLSQLDNARAALELDSSTRVGLEDKLVRLNKTRHLLQSKLTDSQQQASESQLQADRLSTELEQTQAAAELRIRELAEIAEKSKAQVNTLQSELSIAQHQVIDEAKQKEESLNTSKNELDTLQDQLSSAESSLTADLTLQQETTNKLQRDVETLKSQLDIALEQATEVEKQREESLSASMNELGTLRDQLSTAETSLANGTTPQQEATNKLQQEVDSLKTVLAQTEENLTTETEFRHRVEKNSGSQIESLIDDVNQARTAARREAETRTEFEKETQRKIDLIAVELGEARTALEAESGTRAELDRLNKVVEESSQLLNEAESRVKRIQLEKEAAEKQVLANKNALDMAGVEAMRSAKAEQAAVQTPAPSSPTAAKSPPASTQTESISTESASDGPSSADLTIAEDETSPIYSSRDMSNPILRSMVERFTVRLSQHLDAMDTVLQQQDYLELVVIVNWIKSEAFNLGFSEFDPLVSTLETCLRQQEFDAIPNIIRQLRKLDFRIKIQDVPVDDGASLGVKPQSIGDIKISLPVGEKKTELLENFISQLGSKLLEMQSAWNEGNAKNLEKVCTWILRYGGRLHLPVIISATEELQSAIKHADVDRISQKLWNFIGLYSHIELERKL